MSRPPRLARFSYIGKHSYFLTFCTFDRREMLRDDAAADMVLQQFRRTARRHRFALLAYCLMPDHVHLLVTGLTDGADLRRFVKSAKQSSGQRYAKGEGERLWQESYYDHVVRPEESLFHLARYVIENPVKAGLVTDPRRYGHCGSDTWSLDELLSTTP